MASHNTSPKKLNELSKPLREEAQFFLEPATPRQRQYEALRAYFVEQLPVKEVATRFGYTPGAFYGLCHQFRHTPNRAFFLSTKPGPKYSPKRDGARERVLSLRKQNYSVQDIHDMLTAAGLQLSTVSIWTILKEEGFARLPRRSAAERPHGPAPAKAAPADKRRLSLEPRLVETRLGGVFLLLRLLAESHLETLPSALGWYGSKMIPPANAFLACLLLKLIGKARKSHVMDLAFDEGVALAVGLNVLPKTAYMAEYSERITHADTLKFLQRWLQNLRETQVIHGDSFNLDFQSLPYFGEDDVVEKHYVSMRSRRQKAMLVFFAQDESSKIFCYSNADLRKGEEAEEIFRFIAFWKQQTGKPPPPLVFDSRLTTYANLSKLNQMGITFLTLKRRSPRLLQEILARPASAWRTISLCNVARKFRTPKVIDQAVPLRDYVGTIRQIWVKDLGHERPTILITNDKKTACPELITRYAQRMLIENSIAQSVDFFHTRALSSSVAMRIDFDVLLTLVAQATYQLLAYKLRGYEHSGADVLFRKFIDTPAKILIGPEHIEVRLNKRANNPILLHSGLVGTPFTLPWVQNKPFLVTLR